MNAKNPTFWISACLVALLAEPGVTQAQTRADADVVTAISNLENDAVKADLAGDAAFYQKILAEDWTRGDSDGTFYTKAELLKLMADTKNIKTNSEKLSELKVRAYGNTAEATYKDTYDILIMGEHRAQPRVEQCGDRGVTVLRGVHVVRPVEQRGDSAVQRLHRVDEVAGVGVFGREESAQPEMQSGHVLPERPVGRDAAQERLPGVPVRVDEPGHDHRAGAVDDLRVDVAEVGADRLDRVAGHEDVGAGEVTERVVHRDDGPVLDHQSACLHRFGPFYERAVV